MTLSGVYFRIQTDHIVDVTLYPTGITGPVDDDFARGIAIAGLASAGNHIDTIVTRVITKEVHLQVICNNDRDYLGRITSIIQGSC